MVVNVVTVSWHQALASASYMTAEVVHSWGPSMGTNDEAREIFSLPAIDDFSDGPSSFRGTSASYRGPSVARSYPYLAPSPLDELSENMDHISLESGPSVPEGVLDKIIVANTKKQVTFKLEPIGPTRRYGSCCNTFRRPCVGAIRRSSLKPRKKKPSSGPPTTRTCPDEEFRVERNRREFRRESSVLPLLPRPAPAIRIADWRNNMMGEEKQNLKKRASTLPSVMGLVVFKKIYMAELDAKVKKSVGMVNNFVDEKQDESDFSDYTEDTESEEEYPADDRPLSPEEVRESARKKLPPSRFASSLSTEAQMAMLKGYDDVLVDTFENTGRSRARLRFDRLQTPLLRERDAARGGDSKEDGEEEEEDASKLPQIQTAMDLLDSLKDYNGHLVTSKRHRENVENPVRQFRDWRKELTKDNLKNKEWWKYFRSNSIVPSNSIENKFSAIEF